MHKFYCFIAGLAISAQLSGQSLNMVLEDTWDGAGGDEYSDIWGYAAPNGTEVAIIGSEYDIHFVDVTIPNNVQLIQSFSIIDLADSTTSRSFWRDIKTYGHYAYACADQSGTSSGLLVFDLSNVPVSVSFVDQTNSFFNRSHNIFIDEAHGRLYAAGSDTNPGGITVFDIATDPENPVEIGDPSLMLGYVHDIYVRDHMAYCSHGNDQTLTIYDFTDPANPVWVKDIDGYPEPGYNHSSWLDASGTKLVFADETFGRSLKLVNPNLSNFQTTNFHTFKSQLEAGDNNSIAHNPFILGDLVFISYYHDGVQVFDISDTNNIVKVAYHDTYVNASYSGYHGCWGVYPYLPSGKIIASDIESGLYVLSLTGSILPLDFLDFRVAQSGHDALISWQVSAPEDGDRFVLEHSRDGVDFPAIASVQAERNTLHYSHLHEDLGPGVHYYRVRGILADGSEELTEVRTIHVSGRSNLEVYPTLISDRAIMNVYVPGHMTLYDAAGRLMMEWDVDSEQQLELSIGHLPSGTYYLQLQVAGSVVESIPVTKL